MQSRRAFLSRGSLGLLGAASVVSGFTQDIAAPAADEERIPDGSASKGMITTETELSISRGLAYLYNNKNQDGSYGTGQYRGNVAIASLAAMAYMSAGHQPNRGLYGKAIMDTLRFVLSMENVGGGNPGFLHNPRGTPHGPMYGHGFATLFLAEVYGMVHDRVLREALRDTLHRAIALILKSQAQNPEKAWRYYPGSNDADLSVTICQIMALRSARNAGISVPKSAVDNCTEYVKACQDRMEGWFRYTKRGGGGGGSQGFARTAAGICAFNAAGHYRNSPNKELSQRIEAGLRFLARNRPGMLGGFGRPDIHYFYGHYYAVQAMWTAGGKEWQDWFPAIREELRGRQAADGSWNDQLCQHYGTAMACIILQVPNNYLPILQK
jgi:hypothetical protein